jgi:hypothetical protein
MEAATESSKLYVGRGFIRAFSTAFAACRSDPLATQMSFHNKFAGEISSPHGYMASNFGQNTTMVSVVLDLGILKAYCGSPQQL